MSLDVYLTDKGPCPHCGQRADIEVFSANITHNLTPMAKAALVYGIVWRPEENGVESASQLIVPLQSAIDAMEANPEKYKAHNPSNGWGSFDSFFPWLRDYLEACKQYPRATVRASR